MSANGDKRNSVAFFEPILIIIVAVIVFLVGFIIYDIQKTESKKNEQIVRKEVAENFNCNGINEKDVIILEDYKQIGNKLKLSKKIDCNGKICFTVNTVFIPEYHYRWSKSAIDFSRWTMPDRYDVKWLFGFKSLLVKDEGSYFIPDFGKVVKADIEVTEYKFKIPFCLKQGKNIPVVGVLTDKELEKAERVVLLAFDKDKLKNGFLKVEAHYVFDNIAIDYKVKIKPEWVEEKFFDIMKYVYLPINPTHESSMNTLSEYFNVKFREIADASLAHVNSKRYFRNRLREFTAGIDNVDIVVRKFDRAILVFAKENGRIINY